MKDCLIKERTAKWDINEFLSGISHIIKKKKYFITETIDVSIVSTICRCKYKIRVYRKHRWEKQDIKVRNKASSKPD